MNRALGIVTRPAGNAVALGVLLLLLYLPTVRFDFVDYDDGVYVFKNEAVLNGLSADGLAYAFTTVDGGSWMPLTWLSHLLDTSLFGPGPTARHAVNAVLHALTSALLLLAWHGLSGCLWRSTLVSALFALHPLRTESVAWIAERKDALSGLCLALGLLAYRRYLDTRDRRSYLLLALSLTLGLMAKPMLVTFPLVLLLLDFWPLQRFGNSWPDVRRRAWPLVREKIPLLLLAFTASAVTYWSQRETGTLSHWSNGLFARASDVVANLIFYLVKIFAPVDRTVLYPEHHLSTGSFVAATVVLVAISLLAVRRAFKQPWFAVGWFWFLITIAPVIGIVPVGMSMVADRYTYLPSIGLGLALVWAIGNWWPATQGARRAAIASSVLLLGGFAVLTHLDLKRWQNSRTLFEAAIRVAPHKVAYDNLACHYLLHENDADRAADLATRAIELDPKFGPSYSARCVARASLGDYARAKQDYDLAVRFGDRPIRLQSAPLPGKTRRETPEAEWEMFAASIRLEPRTADGFVARGENRLKLGEPDLAIADFSRAIELNPDSAAAHNGRGGAYNFKADSAAAIRDATRALELNASLADAYTTRAIANTRLGKLALALADNQRCVELSPTNALPYLNRAVTWLQLKDYDRAWQDVERCRALGGRPHESFLRALSDASGRKDSPKP